MTLVKCPQGHFYDSGRFGSNCPFCGQTGTSAAAGDQTTTPLDTTDLPAPLTMPATAPLNPTVTSTAPLNSAVPPVVMAAEPDQDKTLPVTTDMLDGAALGVDPVIGWLVCVEGSNKGMDYRLHQGRNFIGRSSAMDVCIAGDNTVSRSSHAVVVYDPRSNVYLAQPGDSKELLYINGSLVLNTTELKPLDKLNIGSTVLMFVPLCGENFHW